MFALIIICLLVSKLLSKGIDGQTAYDAVLTELTEGPISSFVYVAYNTSDACNKLRYEEVTNSCQYEVRMMELVAMSKTKKGIFYQFLHVYTQDYDITISGEDLIVYDNHVFVACFTGNIQTLLKQRQLH